MIRRLRAWATAARAVRLAVLVLSTSCTFFACSRGSRDSASGLARSSDPTLDIVFTYGSEKQSWIEEATNAFNAERRRTVSGKVVRVEGVPLGSGESIEELLAGRRRAHVTSPAAAAFIKLGNAESRAKTGRVLVGPTQKMD